MRRLTGEAVRSGQALAEAAREHATETAGRLDTSGSSRVAPRRYPARAGDEAFRPNGQARPPYRQLLDAVITLGYENLAGRTSEVRRWTSDIGMTFGVDGRQQPFPVDLLPRIVSGHEWSRLRAGLAQRARAIEAFLQDAYGPARLLADGVLPVSDLSDCSGWQNEGRRLPTTTVRAPVMGFDLVRNTMGGWQVLEDNVRVPSGVGYAMAARELMDSVAADLPRPPGLLSPATTPGLLARTLRACAPDIREVCGASAKARNIPTFGPPFRRFVWFVFPYARE